MDDFFKNLKKKLSFESAQECLTDDRDFDVAIVREEKEEEDKPCYGVLHKPNEPTILSTQSGKKTIDEGPVSDTGNTSNQKSEESKGPEKKKSGPAIDASMLF